MSKIDEYTAKYTVNGFFDFLLDNKFSVVVTVFFLLLGYGIKLFSLSFSIDTEAIISATSEQYNAWFTLGRTGLVVFKYLLGLGWYNNGLASFLMVSFFGVSSLLWGYLLYEILRPNKDYIVFFTVPFITSPIFAEMLGFLLTGLEIAIAVGLISISLMLIHNAYYFKIKIYYIFAICLSFIAFNIYLTMITLFMLGVCFIVLIKIQKEKCFSRYSFKYFTVNIFVFLCAFFLYQIFDRVSLFILDLNTNSYITDQFRWNKDDLSTIVNTLLEFGREVYSGNRIYYTIFFTMLSLIFMVFFIWDVLKNKNSLWGGIFVFCIISSPMMMAVMLGYHSTERTVMTHPLALAFMILFLSNKVIELFQVKKSKYFIIFFFLMVSLNQGYIVNRIFYTESLIYQQDTYLAYQIKQYIDELGFGERPNYPVAYLGYHSAKCNDSCYTSRQLALTGRSLFEISFGNEHGTFVKNHFMAAQGIYYDLPSNEQISRVSRNAQNLPNWPSKGSVALVDDVIVVKFND